MKTEKSYNKEIDLIPDGAIKKTGSYTAFKRKKGNRLVIPSHVRALKTAIARRDLTRIRPLVVDTNGFLIDGQHRLQALKELDKPVHYIVIPDSKNGDLMELNTTDKNWRMDDYINSFAEMGNKNYIQVKNLMEETGMSANVLRHWTVGNPDGKRDIFKTGQYEFSLCPKTKEALEYTSSLLDILIKKQIFRSTKNGNVTFHRACKILFMSPLVDNNKMLAKFSLLATDLRKSLNSCDILRDLLSYYNSGLSKKNRVSLVSDGSIIRLERSR